MGKEPSWSMEVGFTTTYAISASNHQSVAISILLMARCTRYNII